MALTYPEYQIDYVISALEHECERPEVEFSFANEANAARFEIADWLAGTFLSDLRERVEQLRDDAMPDEDAEDTIRLVEREAIRHFATDVKNMLQRRIDEVAANIRDGSEAIPDLDLDAAYVKSAEAALASAYESDEDKRQCHMIYHGPQRGLVRAPIIDDLIRSLRTGT